MSSKYKFVNPTAVYFITATVVDWADVYTRNIYREILLDSFKFCQKNQGLQIHAWVLMPNHFHMICSCTDNNEPGIVFKNIKSFRAIKIIDAILNNPKESRKHWLLDIFEKNGKQNKSNYRYQFWQHENHPILLDHYSNSYIERLNYIHQNPGRETCASVTRRNKERLWTPTNRENTYLFLISSIAYSYARLSKCNGFFL